MGARSKVPEPLDHVIRFRLSEASFKDLEALRKNSNCRTLGEFVRSIVIRERIIWYHKDASMDEISVQLAGVRKELRAIGTNINQVTHFLHGAQVPVQKLYHAQQIAQEYSKVTYKVEQVLAIIANIQKKWSQGSKAERT
jgi:hypothetical protein